MRAIFLGIVLLASSLHAQPGGNCAVVDCPSNFLPNPGPPTTIAAKKMVADAMAAIKSADLRERTAVQELEDRYVEIQASLRKPYERLPQWVVDKIVTPKYILKTALKDSDYIQKQEILRTAVAGSYSAHNAAILEVSKAYGLFPPVRDFNGDPRAAGVNMVAKPWRRGQEAMAKWNFMGKPSCLLTPWRSQFITRRLIG